MRLLWEFFKRLLRHRKLLFAGVLCVPVVAVCDIWITVEIGDALPYLPEHQLFAEIGYRYRGWTVFVSASYVDEMRTKAGQGPIPEHQQIESHLVLDGSLEYDFRSRYRAFVQVRNLTDEVFDGLHNRWGSPPPFSVGDYFRFAGFHDRHARISCSEIDSEDFGHKNTNLNELKTNLNE